MLTLLLVCAFSPRKYKSILRGFYNAVSLPGDASHTALLKSHCRGRQCSLFCLYAPFPASTQYPAGTPDLAVPRNNIVLRMEYYNRQCLAMTIFNPQRAKGTHRAARCIAFADRQNIVSSLLPTGKTAFQRFSLSNSLTSPGFSGILALRVSRTVASQDEESPSITRQGAGEIPVKATSRKVQQRYTARFIV